MLKHGLWWRYAPVFCTKASTYSTGRRAVILDGYAGPGQYRDGTPGSPAIALQVAENLAAMSPPRQLHCFFVDSDPGYVDDLNRLVEDRPGGHTVRLGRIEDHLAELVAEAADLPLLAFLDPFGLGISLEQLSETLLNRPNTIGGATEILLNFNLGGLPRIGGLLTSPDPGAGAPATLARLDAVLGGAAWRDLWDPADTATSSLRLAELFCDEAREVSRRGWGYYRAGVSDHWGGRSEYVLILLTAHPDGAWYFNEALSKSLEDFYTWCHPGQQTTEDPSLRKDEFVAKIADNIQTLLGAHGAFRVKDFMSGVYGDTLGWARGLHVRAAVKKLHKDGRSGTNGKGGNPEDLYVTPPP